MTKRRTNPDFLNGIPELVVLQLLARKPMYGYELVQAVRSSTGDALSFGEGCIYPILHKLERQGHLTSRRESVRGRERVVYRVNKAGRTKLAATVTQWTQVVDAVTSILQGGKNAQPIPT